MGRSRPAGVASSRPKNLTGNLPDIAGACGLLIVRPDIDASHIGLFGESMVALGERTDDRADGLEKEEEK